MGKTLERRQLRAQAKTADTAERTVELLESIEASLSTLIDLLERQ